MSLKTREAQQRMEEMQRLLGHRANSSEGVVRPRIRAGSIFEVPSASPGAAGPPGQLLRSLAAVLGEADQCLNRASANQDKLERGIHDVTGQYKEVSTEPLWNVLASLIGFFCQKLVEQERMRLELQQSKRQTELVKELLADATAEKEIMYEVRTIKSLTGLEMLISVLSGI
jgi:protein ECT2